MVRDPHHDTQHFNLFMITSSIIDIGRLLGSEPGTSESFELEVSVEAPDFSLASPVKGDLLLTRVADFIEGELKNISFEAKLECGRCLTPLTQVITIGQAEKEFPIQAVGPVSESSEELALDTKRQKLDIAPFLREEIIISLTFVPLCRPDCKGLCPECGANWNETTCEHQDTSPEGTAKKLKGLKDLYKKFNK